VAAESYERREEKVASHRGGHRGQIYSHLFSYDVYNV